MHDMQEYRVGIAYERYGHITVKAHKNATEEEVFTEAEKKLERMTVEEMDAVTEYLPDSEEIDREGGFRQI